MIIIVLLNVRATAIYIEVMVEKPNHWPMKNPIIEVNITWPTPVTKETLPTSFIILGFKFNPTINKSNAMPICAKVAKASVD